MNNQKQLDNNKENLKLVAGECLKAIESVDGLRNTQTSGFDHYKSIETDVKKMRNDLDAFKNSLSIDVFNKIKEIKNIADA